MKQEQLNTIKERVAKATPGPWEYDEDERGIWNKGGFNYLGTVTLSHNSAEFIAHAREDVPALVAEVERLKIELDAARIANNTLKSEKKGFREANERLTADLFERIEFNGKFAKQNIDDTKEIERLLFIGAVNELLEGVKVEVIQIPTSTLFPSIKKDVLQVSWGDLSD